MKLRWLVPFGLLLLMAGQCLYFAWDTGQTVDEPFYNGSGYPMVRFNNYQILGEHPPLIMQLGSIPLLFLQPKYPIDEPIILPNNTGFDLAKMGDKFLYQMGNDPYLLLFLERSVVILITLFLGWVIFRWANELFGFSGAVMSLALYSICPNIIAHGSQFTTDLGVTAFFFFALYRLKRFFDFPSLKNGTWAGIFCGLALMTKISSFVLFPVVLILFILSSFFREKNADPAKSYNFSLDKWVAGLSLILFMFSVGQKLVFLALSPLCVMGISLTRLGDDQKIFFWGRKLFYLISCILCIVFLIAIFHKRHLVIVLASALWIAFIGICTLYVKWRRDPNLSYMGKIFVLIWLLSAVVIALGYTDFYQSMAKWNPFHHYVRTFNIASSHSLSGHGGCVAGSFVTCDWRYFSGSVLIKTPVLTLCLFFLGLFLVLRSQISKMNKSLLIVPPVVFFLVASFLNQIYIGIRHVLPVYPFIFLISGAVLPAVFKIRNKWAGQVIAIFLVSLFGLTVFRNVHTAPHYLSYFNELIGNANAGVRHIPINAGQDSRRLAELMKEKNIPSAYIASTSGNPTEFNYHQINWEYVQDTDYTNPRPGFYAIDFETYRDQQKNENSWFYHLKPKYQVGETLYVFEKS